MLHRFSAVAILLGSCTAGLCQQTVIKMGTLAPVGSPWHQVLQQMGERWRTISAGRVKLVIYAGGVLGDEPDLVNKMRIGQIRAVALSGAGMSVIEPGVAALQIPTQDPDIDRVVDIITDGARTGNYGDGKIFVTDVDEAYTVRTGLPGL